MMQLDKKFNIKSTTETGWFAGYASVYDHVDYHKDVVMKGAFTETLQSSDTWPKMLWQHDPAHPIGRWEKIEEREDGLYVEGRLFLELPKAQEAFVLLKEGVVNALSIGFHIEKSRRLNEARLLEKLKLYEVSLVTFPANTEARILEVKQHNTLEDLLSRVEALRDEIRLSFL